MRSKPLSSQRSASSGFVSWITSQDPLATSTEAIVENSVTTSSTAASEARGRDPDGKRACAPKRPSEGPQMPATITGRFAGGPSLLAISLGHAVISHVEAGPDTSMETPTT